MEMGATEGGSFRGEPWIGANGCPLFQQTFSTECREKFVDLPAPEGSHAWFPCVVTPFLLLSKGSPW